jgi:FixJ family two-component response regulator
MMTRIALVDDEASVRVALSRVLRLAGYEVGVYASGKDFLDAIDDFRPDCALLDIHMPGLTGLQVQHQLQAQHAQVPAVLITASEDADMRSRVHDAGGFCLLHKPFSRLELLSSIEAAMRAPRPAAP